jgi:hypothetical protein
MTKFLAASLALCLAMTLGCEKKAEQAKSSAVPAAQKDEHGHDAGSHEGHEHHAGEKHDLGTTKVGDFEVAASYSGTITPGKEVDVDLTLKGERGKVAAIRAWIGTEDAKSSIKAKAAPEGEAYHAEVEAPEPMPAGAALWIEIETNQAQKLVGNLALK